MELAALVFERCADSVGTVIAIFHEGIGDGGVWVNQPKAIVWT